MTNEEKIKELATRYTQYDSDEDVNIVDVFGALRETAKWKDQQFKEYLEKKKDNYIRHREMWQQDTIEYCCYDSQIDTIDEIINEIFKGD